MILLVTNERDITSDYIVLETQRRGLKCVRLNTESLPTGSLSFAPNEQCEEWTYHCNTFSLSFSSIRAAYFRRPGAPSINPAIDEHTARHYCEQEWNAVMSALLQSLDGRWLNSPGAIAAAENKPRQLQLARQVGFQVPETVVTNAPEVAIAFSGRGPTVAKPLKAALLGNGSDEQVIFTTRVHSLGGLPSESLTAAPIILQREIGKQCDIRATVVGQNVLAAEIHSQVNEETVTDWRRGAHTDVPHKVHKLPARIGEMCVAITRLCGLRFGAIDLVLDVEGAYWFLELNPNGQWAWIENRTGLPIAAAIVDELERIRSEH